MLDTFLFFVAMNRIVYTSDSFYLGVFEELPARFDEEDDSVHVSWESHAANQKDEQNNVGEDGSEINNL